jgi:adenosylcobinamide-GDP ribazoletransferase
MSPISATCWPEISKVIDRSRFLDALRFLTIVPVPPSATATDPDWLAKSLKYFPVVGIGIGILSAAVWLFTGAIWNPAIAALLAVAASIVVTGALHEDGLADTVDGLGGGRTIEQRLTIMKDSRIGAYGALALGFGVALRVAALTEMPAWTAAAALVAGHAAARVTPAFVLARMVYVGDVAAMKVSYEQAPVRPDEFRFALIVVIIAALPLAWLSFTALLSGLMFGGALAVAFAGWSRRLIGGYTGDVLGAIEQIFEITFLLGVAAVIR